MRVLAFDLGRTFGWAIWKDGKVIGVDESEPTKGEKEIGPALLRLYEEAVWQIREGVDLIAWEYVAFARGPGAIILSEQRGVLRLLCEQMGVPYGEVQVPTLKKWATGSGRAQKPEMLAEAQRRCRVPIHTDNEADAALVALWAVENVLPGVTDA